MNMAGVPSPGTTAFNLKLDLVLKTLTLISFVPVSI